MLVAHERLPGVVQGLQGIIQGLDQIPGLLLGNRFRCRIAELRDRGPECLQTRAPDVSPEPGQDGCNQEQKAPTQ